MIQYVKIGRYNNKEGVFNNHVHCLTIASVMHFVQKRRDWRTSGRGHYVAGEVRNRDEFFLLLKSIPFLMKIKVIFCINSIYCQLPKHELKLSK